MHIISTTRTLSLVFLGLLLTLQPAGALSAPASVQNQNSAPAEQPEKSDEKGPKEFKGLKYRLLGPGWGGRVARASGVAGNPNVYYAASASGGVWKSVDAGIT